MVKNIISMVIIGGGFAGIHMAYLLKNKGCKNVIILDTNRNDDNFLGERNKNNENDDEYEKI